VSGVFFGGLPVNFLAVSSSQGSNTNQNDFRLIQNRNFQGCLKNISTILEIVDSTNFLNSSNSDASMSKKIDFDFLNNAEYSPGESKSSNTILGCPLDLELSANETTSMLYMMGLGYFYINLRQTLPVAFQTNQFIILDFSFRTEFSQGLLFFNYDIDNDQFMYVRLLSEDRMEFNFKSRVRYEDSNSNDLRFTNFFDLSFNETYKIPNLSKGYWTNMNLQFDLVNRTFWLNINQTRVVLKSLINNATVPANLFKLINKLTIRFTFYLNVQFYFGGFNTKEIEENLEMLTESWVPRQTREYFTPLFRLFESLDYELHFSGCIKSIKINSFPVDIWNLNNGIRYENVRFDGCPNLKYLQPKAEANRLDPSVIYEGGLNTGFDTSFKPFTEYFYRVVAFNNQGESCSDWILVRSPEATPQTTVNISLLNATATSGYKILVQNLIKYCFYCDISNRLSDFNNINTFTGIINRFVMTVRVFNKTLNDFIIINEYPFYCETVCYKSSTLKDQNSSRIENLLKDDELNINEVFIDTKPISNYSLVVSVCTQTSCSYSQAKYLVTLAEVPDGIFVPESTERSANSISLKWKEPLYTSGNITGYILRLDESIIYFGLRREYRIMNLKALSNYSFTLEVCNAIGCARSTPVSFLTTEMAPLSVPAPIILNITQTRILVKWNKPNNDQIVNGFLIGYILYLNYKNMGPNNNESQSFNISTCLECSANFKELNDLSPGTEYVIILSACTSGGCTNSSELRVNTLESLPLVDDLKIFALNKTSTSLVIGWTRPKSLNGKENKYILYRNDKQIYEGLNLNFTIQNLDPNTILQFYIVFCNNFGCAQSKTFRLSTDEDKPNGELFLEASSTGPNQIQLKWFSDPKNPLIPNGNLLFSAFFTGPFLIDLKMNNSELIEYTKLNRQLVELKTHCLLNTTVLNTKYGVLDRILPFSEYIIYINGTNSKGFILSNQVRVLTMKSSPDLLLPPQLTRSTPTNLRLEWFDPLLINSDDKIFFYQIEYKIKFLWDQNGVIESPSYDNKIIKAFNERKSTNIFTLHSLRPYTAYTLQLIVYNSFGQAKSEWSRDFLTQEDFPLLQEPPKISFVGSKFVVVELRPPRISNGLINEYQLLVFNCHVNIGVKEFVKNITLNSENFNLTNLIIFNITDLISFTNYTFSITSCNSIGCTSSLSTSNCRNDPTSTKTNPFPPELLDNPILSSPNSYSIDIRWKMPQRPNGLISHFLLERFDYALPISFYNQNNTIHGGDLNLNLTLNKNNIKKKYKFEPNKFRFLDYDGLSSCGIYSYRLKVFNQVGQFETNWTNISVRASKPLIVTSPIINLIDSKTARFEWIKPLTLCKIKSYTLLFDSIDSIREHSFQIEIENTTSQSILINRFRPFTIYRVKLIACVIGNPKKQNSSENLCTESLSKTFQTTGEAPQLGTDQIPLARLVSPNAISIEWMEPISKNGQSLKYQLVRQVLTGANRTEAIYLGTNLYFLDLNVQKNLSFKYRVIFTNEFGSSISNWSNLISIDTSQYNKDDNNTFITYINSDATRIKIRLNFDLRAKCSSATSTLLEWKPFRLAEIINLLNSYDTDKIESEEHRKVLIKNNLDLTKLNEKSALFINMSLEINEKFYFLITNDTDLFDKLVRFSLHNLIPEKMYKYVLKLKLVLDYRNKTRYFDLISETSSCQTNSIQEMFGDKPLQIVSSNIEDNNKRNNTLIIKYNLSKNLLQNYQIFKIYLNKTIQFNRKNNDSNQLNSILIDIKQVFDVKDPILVFNSIEQNAIYEISLWACSTLNNGKLLIYFKFLVL
jgi:hypothetical protein